MLERDDPEAHARDVLWPEKVRLNREYVQNYSLLKDLYYIALTLIPGARPS